MVSKTRLIVSDFIVSIICVWTGTLIKMFVLKVLEIGHDSRGEFIWFSLSVMSLFFFAFLAKFTKGASYNPLAVLSSAISGDFSQFLFTIGTRIPAQVMGWAYARGDHITKEHILVYWLAPVQGALLAAWTFKLLFQPQKQDEDEKLKGKTD